MKFLRHLLAVGLVAGCVYLYFQDQKTSPEVSLAETPFDPAIGWEIFEQAPAFNANNAAPEPAKTEQVPQPIPFPAGGKTDLVANLTNWSEKATENLQQTAKDKQQQISQTISEVVQKPKSLWDEPVVENASKELQKTLQGQTEQAVAAGKEAVDAGKTAADKQLAQPAAAAKQQLSQAVENLTQQAQDAAQKAQQAVKDTAQQAQKQAQEQAKKVAAPAAAAASTAAAAATTATSSTAPTESYRQFTLGTGEEKVVCVVDSSVSSDGLLLSTLFAGLRREWISDVKRSQEQSLVMLVADNQSKETAEKRQQELIQKTTQLKPVRIVHVTQGNDQRGWLRFNSEEESITALMSVPGIFKIQGDGKDDLFSKTPETASIPSVRVELPQKMEAQETTTVGMLATALAGNWSERQNLPYTGQITPSMAKPTSVDQPNRETTSSFFKNLYENTLGGKNSPEKPVENQPTLGEKAEQFMAQILGSPEPFPQDSAKAQTKTQTPESSPPAALKSDPEKAAPAKQPDPQNEKALASAAQKPEPTVKKIVPQVEILPPPQTYSPESYTPGKPVGEFYKLPAPPV